MPMSSLPEPLSPALFQRTDTHSEQRLSQNLLLISDRENMHSIKSSLMHRDCTVQSELIANLCSPSVRNELINQLKLQPPTVLWIHVPHWEEHLAIEEQRRVAICIATLLHIQLEHDSRHVVIEGNLHHYQSWYPDRLRKALNHPRLSTHNVWWCGLGVRLADKPICRYSKVICTLPTLPLNVVNSCKTDNT